MKSQVGCTAAANGDCAHCSIDKEMKQSYCDAEILTHMGEAGCIIAKEAAEQFFYEIESAEAEAEAELAEAYAEEFGDGEWENDEDDQDYHDDYFDNIED